MSRIEETLRIRAMFAEGGASFTDEELWTKAFRLKRFGRCPWCDGSVKAWRCYIRRSSTVECMLCEFSGEIFDNEFRVAEDIDDPIIELVQDALGIGFVIEEPSKRVSWVETLGFAVLVAIVIAAAVLAYSVV